MVDRNASMKCPTERAQLLLTFLPSTVHNLKGTLCPHYFQFMFQIRIEYNEKVPALHSNINVWHHHLLFEGIDKPLLLVGHQTSDRFDSNYSEGFIGK